jgi:DNA-binding NarL/FixJ family response regulator
MGRYKISVSYVDGDAGTTPDTIVVLVDPLELGGLGPQELATRFFLTGREIEAAQLLRKGLSNRAIAGVLGISVNTARRHVEHVLLKLGVHSRTAVAARLYGD